MPQNLASSLLKSIAASLLFVGTGALQAGPAEPPRVRPPDQPVALTPERVEELPDGPRAAWAGYLERSSGLRANLPASLPTEDGRSRGAAHSRGLRLKAPASWYAGAEAQAVANRVVEAQSVTGGWDKGWDYIQVPLKPSAAGGVWRGGTFDNGATVTELRVLALTLAAAPEDNAQAPLWQAAFLRGLEYVLSAQYPNGGYPQIFPLAGGYHDAITLNDGVMVGVLQLLQEIAEGEEEFSFVSPEVKTRCAAAVQRGIRCLLDLQLRSEDGKRSAWCQQHDPLTLKPCAARNFEPASTSSAESAGVVRFLMDQPQPTPEIVEAVDGAVRWMKRTALRDLHWDRLKHDALPVPMPGALLWSRFYELGTDRPIFGDRDRSVHYSVDGITPERRHGYAWYGTWPAAALERHEEWKEERKAR